MVLERWAVKEGTMQEVLHGDFHLRAADYDLVLSQGKDATNVGMQVWEAGVMLGKYLEFQVETGARDLRGKNIVELGAGTGVAGMVCALLGANVVLTDLGGPVVDLMEENVGRNIDHIKAAGGVVSVMPLDFNSEKEALAVIESLPGSTVDIVLAADVMYVENIIAPLLDTMNVMHTNDRTETLISFGFYRLTPLLDFFHQTRINYTLKKIAPADLHPAHNSADISIRSLRTCKETPRVSNSDGIPDEDSERQIQQTIQSLQEKKAGLLEALGRLEWKSSDLLGDVFTSTDKDTRAKEIGKLVEVEALTLEKAAILEQLGRLEWKSAMEVASLRELTVSFRSL